MLYCLEAGILVVPSHSKAVGFSESNLWEPRVSETNLRLDDDRACVILKVPLVQMRISLKSLEDLRRC